jgi:hypothetical protein
VVIGRDASILVSWSVVCGDPLFVTIDPLEPRRRRRVESVAARSMAEVEVHDHVVELLIMTTDMK